MSQLKVTSEINFEQQLTSERQFLEQSYGSNPWCVSIMPPFTIGNGNNNNNNFICIAVYTKALYRFTIKKENN